MTSYYVPVFLFVNELQDQSFHQKWCTPFYRPHVISCWWRHWCVCHLLLFLSAI